MNYYITYNMQLSRIMLFKKFAKIRKIGFVLQTIGYLIFNMGLGKLQHSFKLKKKRKEKVFRIL